VSLGGGKYEFLMFQEEIGDPAQAKLHQTNEGEREGKTSTGIAENGKLRSPN